MTSKLPGMIVHEIKRILPPTLLFLVSLNLLVLTVAVLSDEHEISTVSHVLATIGALLIGKAVLLADMLPFFHRYSGRPLIYATLWKALLYLAMAMTLHIVERLVKFATAGDGILASMAGAFGRIDWTHFLIVQTSLAILLLMFVAFR